MTSLRDLAEKPLPDAKIDVAEPYVTGSVGWLDISYKNKVLAIQWQEKRGFGVSSPVGHGYGEKPSKVYQTSEEAAKIIVELLK